MRILRLISTMNPGAGGPCQGIRNSIPALESLGCQNEVVSLDSSNAPFLQTDNFPVHAIGPSRTSWAYSSTLTPWLLDNLSKYDTVIQHGLWQYDGYALMKAVRKLRREKKSPPRWFIYPHGMLDPWFQKARTRRLKAIRNFLYWKIIENRVIQSADGLLFTCQEEMKLAANTFRPYRPKKACNVGYGISDPPSNSGNGNNPFFDHFPGLENKPILLFLSRIHPKKGIDLLLQAYAQVQRKALTTLPQLVIAGPCVDRTYWEHLQQQAVTLGLQNNPISFESMNRKKSTRCINDRLSESSTITWTGMLSGPVKWGAFHAAEAFILPSHQENFGISVVEAMACRTPVLISNKVNIWREVETTEAGLVADDNLQGTVRLLEKWISTGENFRTQMQENSMHCYRTNFSIDKSIKKVASAIGMDISEKSVSS